MKIVEYAYEVRARIQLTEAEIYHLIDLALSHYDYKCKSAGRAGPGGFLNGFKNTIRADGQADFHLTYDELDTFNKILEQPGADPGLREAAHRILCGTGEEGARVRLIMNAVHNQKSFVHAPYTTQPCETLVLSLDDIREAMYRARQAPQIMDITPDHYVAQGVMALYWDQCGGDLNGTQFCLNERELRALIGVLQDHPLQATVQAALDRLLAQPKAEIP